MRYISYILCVFFLFTASGCEDELLPDGSKEKPNYDVPFTLTFTTAVPAMDDEAPKTRAIYYGNPTYYEDWVDTQDGVRVLFFLSRREKTNEYFVQPKYEDDAPFAAVDPNNPLKDYFLFESTSRWVSQLPYDEDNTLRYRVTVPLYQIGDEEPEYRDHWSEIRKLLRTYDFKIAILVNHPKCFTWGVNESVLSAKNINDLSGEKTIKTINDIQHSVADDNYNSTNAKRKDGYDMLVDNTHKINGLGTMGPYIDWVTARSQLYGDALGGTFTTREGARNWIRDYWIPDLIYNEDTDEDIDYQTLYHNYRHIWSYWNFGGAAEDNGLPYSTKSTINPHINDWEVRNGALLRDWVTKAVNNNGTFLSDLSTASNGTGKYDGSMPLTFNPSSAKAVIKESGNGKRLYGVQLQSISTPSGTSAKDCFMFNLNAHGTITVRYSGGTIKVIGGSNDNTGTSTSKTINGVNMTEVTYGFQVSDNPVVGYVYCSSGTATVYDIECTQDQYVYLTDREGILPSADHPIPMYGVQKFNALNGWWEEGASFDLTTGGLDEKDNEYDAKTISLLRAVAKIEVLIPKSIGVPKHIYMHSLNRHVRCEPMDVATPTNELWKDHNAGCEWKAIHEWGTMMNSDGSYNKNDYKKKLARYYGSWLEWGWNFNEQTALIPDYEKDGPFPRVMNPYINRADCAAFIDVSDYYNDQFYHYIFYMGESAIDAPGNYDGSSSNPMVPHIRIRFDERYASTCKVKVNSDLNLMGNDCYRIYLTEGGIASGARDINGASKIASTGYDAYQKNPTYLKEHWPIIRNHVYRFTVLDSGMDNMSGIVVNAQNRTADFDFK